MRLLTTLLLATAANAWHKGINIGAQLPNGACRSQADWLRAFETIKALPPKFSSARLFASSDCNTLANAVPAALSAGIKLLVGVWTQNDDHFTQEKQALLDAIHTWPNWADWMIGVSVGSEDLYRKEAPAWQIAQKIYDVRGMLRSVGCTSWVGHVDTWTAWVDPANADVLKAVEWVGSDGYPYWQGATLPQQASDLFWQAITDVKNAVQKTHPGIPVWMTESGWPVKGKSFGASQASVANAQNYWKTVACPAFPQIDVFWYAYSETNADPDFSLVDANDKAIFDLTC